MIKTKGYFRLLNFDLMCSMILKVRNLCGVRWGGCILTFDILLCTKAESNKAMGIEK